MFDDLERLERLHNALKAIPRRRHETIILRERAPGVYTPVRRGPIEIAREISGLFAEVSRNVKKL